MERWMMVAAGGTLRAVCFKSAQRHAKLFVLRRQCIDSSLVVASFSLQVTLHYTERMNEPINEYI